jgi:hypothetical protein
MPLLKLSFCMDIKLYQIVVKNVGPTIVQFLTSDGEDGVW